METEPGHVSISTMHMAKGLEFRAVAIMACDDEVIPLQSRIESVGDDADLKEVYDTERQLLYVACTSSSPASHLPPNSSTTSARPRSRRGASPARKGSHNLKAAHVSPKRARQQARVCQINDSATSYNRDRLATTATCRLA